MPPFPVRGLQIALLLGLAAGSARAGTLSVASGSVADLQAALDAAQDGDVIEIKGVYRTADLIGDGFGPEGFELVERANITLRAKGKAVIDGTGPFSTTGLFVDDVHGLTIEGLTFRNLGSDGIFMSGSSGFTARKCRFIDCGDSGIEDQSTAGFVVEDCRFVRCAWGLACGYDSPGDSGVEVRGSRFVDCSVYGVDLWSSGGLVEDCRFRSPEGDYGVGLRDGFSGATVQDCRFSAMDVGIRAQGSGHSLLANKVKATRDDGIRLLDGGLHTCSENKVSGSKGSGIFLDSTGNTVSGNVIRKSADADLDSAVPEAANTFVDNEYGTSSFP